MKIELTDVLNIEEQYICPLLISIASFDCLIKVYLMGIWATKKWEKEFKINFDKYKHIFL